MGRTVLTIDMSGEQNEELLLFLQKEYCMLSAFGIEEAMFLLRKKFKIISAIIMVLPFSCNDAMFFIRDVRQNAFFQSIPIIITADKENTSGIEKAIEQGANGYVLKPIKQEMLMHTLRNSIKLKETAAMLNTFRRDKLTGLLNREAFFTEAERLIKRHDPGYFVISCFNVENFKLINDQYGIEKGDEVLRHIANCLSGFVDSYNGLTCRFNADKFAVLFPSALLDSRTVRENHYETMSPSCINRAIRIRVGRYVVDDRSISVSSMFDRASLAEKSIKGRYGTYIALYDDSLRDNLLKEQIIVNEMSKALEAGEFVPWLQPQYNHATGAIIGAEALVRWKKGDSFILPNDFIPIFERNGFIYEMDQYLWRQICIFLRKALDDGKAPLPISVNISRYDIFREDFYDVMCSLVKAYDIPVSLLRLEVTESAFAESTKTVINTVNKLIKFGFTVEIDDFGSGYSSLNTLKDVPASILKLDMRFFENADDLIRSGNIIESVVRMAKWLGMSIIAEGVESRDQANYLKTIGCCYIQGYYYARPMPVSEFERLLFLNDKELPKEKNQEKNIHENRELWNPKSAETVVFNSFAESACIVEFYNNNIELLRVNDRFSDELGSFTGSVDSMFLTTQNSLNTLNEENYGILQNCIRKAIALNETASCEIVLSDKKHSEKIEFIRVTIKVIACCGERYMLYGTIKNITECRLAEQKQKIAEKRSSELNTLFDLVSGCLWIIKISEKSMSTIYLSEKIGISDVHKDTDALSFLIPEDFALITEAFGKQKEGNPPTPVCLRIKTPDDDVKAVKCHLKVAKAKGIGNVAVLSAE